MVAYLGGDCKMRFGVERSTFGGWYRNRVSIMAGMNLHEQMHMIWHDPSRWLHPLRR